MCVIGVRVWGEHAMDSLLFSLGISDYLNIATWEVAVFLFGRNGPSGGTSPRSSNRSRRMILRNFTRLGGKSLHEPSPETCEATHSTCPETLRPAGTCRSCSLDEEVQKPAAMSLHEIWGLSRKYSAVPTYSLVFFPPARLRTLPSG